MVAYYSKITILIIYDRIVYIIELGSDVEAQRLFLSNRRHSDRRVPVLVLRSWRRRAVAGDFCSGASSEGHRSRQDPLLEHCCPLFLSLDHGLWRLNDVPSASR